MSSFLDPGLLEQLRQRGLVQAPQPQLGAVDSRLALGGGLGGAQAAPQFSDLIRPGLLAPLQERGAIAPETAGRMREAQGAEPVRQLKAELTKKHGAGDKTWAGLTASTLRAEPGVPVYTQVPVKASWVPQEARERLFTQGGHAPLGWDPTKIKDDEQVVMLAKLVEQNLGNMSPEEAEQAFGAFAMAVQKRPGLRKKFAAAAEVVE